MDKEDEKILEELEEVIKKKKEEIATLNRLLGSIEHPSSENEEKGKEEESEDKK